MEKETTIDLSKYDLILYDKDSDLPVCNKYGILLRVICKDAPGHLPIITVTEDGELNRWYYGSPNLFNYKPKPVTYWINIYKDYNSELYSGVDVYKSIEVAQKVGNRTLGYVKSIPYIHEE